MEPRPIKSAKAAASSDRLGRAEAAHHHVEFAPVQARLWTPANVFLAALMAFGGALVHRPVRARPRRLDEPLRHLGVGALDRLRPRLDRGGGRRVRDGGHHLRVPAQGPLLHRTLRRADGAPQLLLRHRDAPRRPRPAVALLRSSALQAPEHSAMFEVSWCVGLYVTMLAGGVPAGAVRALGHEGGDGDVEDAGRPSTWSSRSPLFVYLMSRNLVYTGARRGGLRLHGLGVPRAAWREAEPIMLAIAAVTLSTMHQSSLGSLFLLMPDKLVEGVVVAGDAGLLLPLLHRGRHRAHGARRDVDREGLQAAAAGGRSSRRSARSRSGPSRSTSRSASVTSAFAASSRRRSPARRRGLLRGRDRRSAASSRSCSSARRSCARTRGRCSSASLLATGGIVLNRVNVVVFAMDLKGAAASDRAADLLPERRRVGHLDRPHRRDHLPLRPGRPAHAGPAEAGRAGGPGGGASGGRRCVASPRRGPPRRA